MTNALLFIAGITLLFAVSAIAGLVWYIGSGQLHGFDAGSHSIFDRDEPIGETTDQFPATSESGAANGEW